MTMTAALCENIDRRVLANQSFEDFEELRDLFAEAELHAADAYPDQDDSLYRLAAAYAYVKQILVSDKGYWTFVRPCFVRAVATESDGVVTIEVVRSVQLRTSDDFYWPVRSFLSDHDAELVSAEDEVYDESFMGYRAVRSLYRGTVMP